MGSILPPDTLESGVLRRPRPLSRRRVKRLVRIGQTWCDEHGWVWWVVNVHRKDGQVQLRASQSHPVVGDRLTVFVTFGELGKRYELVGDD